MGGCIGAWVCGVGGDGVGGVRVCGGEGLRLWGCGWGRVVRVGELGWG